MKKKTLRGNVGLRGHVLPLAEKIFRIAQMDGRLWGGCVWPLNHTMAYAALRPTSSLIPLKRRAVGLSCVVPLGLIASKKLGSQVFKLHCDQALRK